MDRIYNEKDFMNAWNVFIEPYTSFYHDSIFLMKQGIKKLKKSLDNLIMEKK